jgi:hypothetical protein
VIIPVSFSVKRENRPEDLALHLGDVLPFSTFERMRVKMVLWNTQARQAHGFSALVMFDQSAERGHELLTMYQSQGGPGQWASREYLLELRGEIDKLLGEQT